MKDKLGRQIIAGDKVVVIALDHSISTGAPDGRPYLKVHPVAAVADFGIQVDTGGGQMKVYADPDRVVIASSR
jgi:hypothetical protein